MLPQQFTQFRTNAHGFTVVPFALASVIIFGAVGAAVDYASFSRERTRLQAAADAAALSAARELSSTNPAMIADVAKTYATLALGASNSNVTVQTQLMLPDSVRVQMSEDMQPILSGVISRAMAHISVVAVAKLYNGPPLCVLGLDPSLAGDIQLQQLSLMTATNCSVSTNSTNSKALISQDAAILVSAASCSAGGYWQSMPANFVPSPLTDCPPVSDPLASRPPPAVGPCGFVNTTVIGGHTATLSPGVYCGGITVSGGSSAQLLPGVYVIRDGPLAVASGSTMQGQNVGFYLTGLNSIISWDATTHISFTAPNSGPMAGILIYEDQTAPLLRQHTIVSNDARTLLGTIYMPRGNLVIASNSKVADLSAYTVIVARQLNIQASANLVLNTNYGATDIPVPIGLGTRLFGKIRLSQ